MPFSRPINCWRAAVGNTPQPLTPDYPWWQSFLSSDHIGHQVPGKHFSLGNAAETNPNPGIFGDQPNPPPKNNLEKTTLGYRLHIVARRFRLGPLIGHSFLLVPSTSPNFRLCSLMHPETLTLRDYGRDCRNSKRGLKQLR